MFRVEHYELGSKKIKNPITIVMLADLHNHSYGENNQDLLSAVKMQDPDLICLAGDLLIGHSKISYAPAQELVKTLAKDYQVFYGLGNHEARMKYDLALYGTRYEDYIRPLEALGVQVLVDENRKICVGNTELCIYGYDLPLCYFEKFNRYVFETEQVERALGSIEESKTVYRILLAHNPIYFPQYAAWGADLTLSGHLHGGIIRLPLIGGIITPQARLFPKYCAGKYQIGEKNLIVSRGLGTHTIPIRWNNPPELSVIHLAPK